MTYFCEHLNWDNERDCQEEAEFVCECCGAGVCREHLPITKRCPYGGEPFREIDE